MIKINLLPIRQIQKRLKAQKQVIGFCVLLAAVLFVVGIAWAVRGSQISGQKEHISELTQKRNSYQATLNEIEKLKQNKKNLETKLAVIGKLKKDSQFTVRLLDELANVTPVGRIQLNSMIQAPDKITISGAAVDDASIALYMNQLEASPYFANPELGSSNAGGAGAGRNFTMIFGITSPEEKK